MSIRIGGSTYERREIVLVFVAVVAVALCVLFLGLYATKKPSNDGTSDGGNHGVTAAIKAATSTPKPTPRTCNTKECMSSTAYVWSLVNTSADPCENFYMYACGNFANRYPLSPDEYYTDVLEKLHLRNEERVRNLLESPKIRDVPWGSERKAKDLFKSCLNEYGRMKAGANPFIEKVLNKVGGWYVLGNFNGDSWDLLDHLEKVHVDFWTSVLFTVRVWSDWVNPGRRMIVLQRADLGMSSWVYLSSYGSYYNKTRMAYKDYMRTVAGLIVRDSGIQISDTDKTNRINVFINDVMTMETMLANISRSSRYDYQGFQQERRVMIKNLAGITGSTFNWVSFFNYMFDTPNVHKWTYIAVPQRNYIRNMAQAISNMGNNKNRILNNYFTWAMARKYINELSSEYTHAANTFRNANYGTTEFMPTWERCFSFVSANMVDAMSRIFIQMHFGKGNKEKVREIADYVKKAVMDSTAGPDFMDASTRQYAISKLNSVVENLGYPSYLDDADAVDMIYASMDVHDTDFFQNVLNTNKFLRTDLNNQFHKLRSDPDEWGYQSAMDTHYLYMYWLNKLIVPAGALQYPIYDYQLAHYLNFGSMGTILAKDYLSAINHIGSSYDRRGKWYEGSTISPLDYYRGWWSNATYYGYKVIQDCLSEVAANQSQASYTDPSTGEVIPVYIPPFALSWRADLIADEIWRLKAALKGYKAWTDKNGKEPVPPSIGLNNQQMYFVAYAQAQCYTQNSRYTYGWWNYYDQKSVTINVAISQVKEFSDAFQCSAKATLNPDNRCWTS